MKIKNEFKRPEFIEETILDKKSRKMLGTLRLFPSTIKWKPARSKSFYMVSLDAFAEFIVANGQRQKW